MKNSNLSQSRRSVLKSVGGMAGASVTIGVVSAEEQNLNGLEKWRLLRRDKVKQVYDAVGRPDIRSSKKVTGEVTKSDRVNTEGTVHRLHTAIGELRYISLGEHTVAQFIFATLDDKDSDDRHLAPNEDSSPEWDHYGTPQVDEQLREKYDKPFTTSASLYTNEDGDVSYIREATPEELDQLSAATGIKTDSAKMAYSSEVGGFVVQDQDNDDLEPKVVTPRTEPAKASDIDSLADAEVTELSESTTGNISPQGACKEDSCWNCASGLVGYVVVGCGSICMAVSWTIAGIVACVGCILAAGGYVGYNCHQCYDTC